MPIVHLIRDLSGSWLIIVALVIIASRLWSRGEEDISLHLLWVILALLIRKLFLFIPIPGTLADLDHIYYVDDDAFWFPMKMVLVYILSLIGIIILVAVTAGFGAMIVIIMLIANFKAIITGLLLPIFIVAKIVLINPFFVLVIWAYAIINLVYFYRGNTIPSESGLYFLGANAVVALLFYFGQPLNNGIIEYSSRNIPMIASQLDSLSSTRVDVINANDIEEEINDYMSVWWGKIGETNRNRLLVVEKEVPETYISNVPGELAKALDKPLYWLWQLVAAIAGFIWEVLTLLFHFIVRNINIWTPSKFRWSTALIGIPITLIALTLIPYLRIKSKQ